MPAHPRKTGCSSAFSTSAASRPCAPGCSSKRGLESSRSSSCDADLASGKLKRLMPKTRAPARLAAHGLAPRSDARNAPPRARERALRTPAALSKHARLPARSRPAIVLLNGTRCFQNTRLSSLESARIGHRHVAPLATRRFSLGARRASARSRGSRGARDAGTSARFARSFDAQILFFHGAFSPGAGAFRRELFVFPTQATTAPPAAQAGSSASGNGGSATGGSATGGSATGGSATGGSATGGSATGGSATGGSATGGTGGSSPGCASSCARIVGAACGTTTQEDCVAGCNALTTSCAAAIGPYNECVSNPANAITCDATTMTAGIAGCDDVIRDLSVCGICLPDSMDMACGTCTRSTCCDELQAYAQRRGRGDVRRLRRTPAPIRRA